MEKNLIFCICNAILNKKCSLKIDYCLLILSTMSYLDILPLELLHEIAGKSEPAYYAMLVYPRFARAITPGTRIDYMVAFGYNVSINRHYTHWTHNGTLHRKDGPALICTDGSKKWFQNGLKHCDDGPAVIKANEVEMWYSNGVKHREDGPAVMYADGNTVWYRNGVFHLAIPHANIPQNDNGIFGRDKIHHPVIV